MNNIIYPNTRQTSIMFEKVVDFIRSVYKTDDFIPLHAPVFRGNEKKYLNEVIDSTYVSYVGEFVTRFEKMMCEISGADYAVATVNGTCALQIALTVSGVKKDEEVLTQPLTFVATANAITHAGAVPVFIDVDKESLGLSPESLREFLEENGDIRSKSCFNKKTGKRIAACLPVHLFGFPCKIDKIIEVCNKYYIPVVEDAAESLGSKYRGQHTGTFGKTGIFSFNGNKTVTCGGGGTIVTNNKELADRAKHITTTAKVPHPFEYIHDELGYNYRLPNLNAAVACAQLEQLDSFIRNKRELARDYSAFFKTLDNIEFVEEKDNTFANYWLNTLLFFDKEERDEFLKFTNNKKVMTRPAWRLMNKLPMYNNCFSTPLPNAEWLEERIVNIPSSVR